AVLDELPGRIGERLRLLERLHRLIVEELGPGRLRQRNVAQSAVGLQLDAKLGVAVAPSVHGPGGVALPVDLVGMPVLGHLTLDAVEERGEAPALRVERGLVAVVDVAQRVLRTAADRARELFLARHQRRSGPAARAAPARPRLRLRA